MIAPTVRYERRTHTDAGDPQPPTLSYESHSVQPTRGERDTPLAPIDSIGMYQKPSQMMLPLNEVSDGKDASLYGLNRRQRRAASEIHLMRIDVARSPNSTDWTENR